MTEQQLKEAVSKGFANPEHLDELLARTDLPRKRLQDVRTNLAVAISCAKISNEELQRFISQLKLATNLDQFDQILAELRHANQLYQSGVVAKDSPIITSAKLGRQYNLGPTVIQIDPVPEADALYLGTDGLIHLHEVKNTAKALREKLNRHPEQLTRMLEWRKKAPDKREIRMVIGTEVGWTEVFAARSGELAVLKLLSNQRVPLTIGEVNLSTQQMKKLWKATKRQARKLSMYPPAKEFFDMMPTLEAAKELGILFS